MMPRSRLFWFVNAMGLVVLLFAAANALSYFVRSDNWGIGLASPTSQGGEAIGFPALLWSSTQSYPGFPLEWRGALVNSVSAAGMALLAGLYCARASDFLNQFLLSTLAAEQQPDGQKLQFSLKGMLVLTGVAAIVAALVRQSFGPRPELLLAIYFLGPGFLVVLAMIPRSLNWQSRVVLLVPSTVLLIYYAIHVGGKLGLELDRVMLGICIVWVPQTVLGAVAIMTYHGYQFVSNGERRLK